MTKRKLWAQAVKDRDGNKCVICGNADNLNAHHIYCEGYFPNLQYILSNGITLCRKCHTLAHRGKFGASSKGKYHPQIAIEKLRQRACEKNICELINTIIQADVECCEKAKKAGE